MNLKLSQKIWAMENLPPMEKLIMLSLAYHCNYESSEYLCWPSLKTLAKNTSLSLSSVQRCLKKLQEKGLITIHKTDKNNTKLRSNYYEIEL